MRIVLEMEKTRVLQTGLGMFCFHLGKNLLEKAGSGEEIGFYLPENRQQLFGSEALTFVQKAHHKLFFSADTGADVWHCCHQDSPYYPGRKTPMVLTIHDLNFMQKYRGWRREYRKKKLGRMLERSSALVCISRETGRHLEEVYSLNQSDYQVIHNGNCLSHFPGSAASKFQRNRPYFLCIGVLSARKNAHVLCGMMARFPEYDLILAGPTQPDYLKTVSEEAEKSGIKKQLILAGEVSEEEKYRLYQNTEALLFPSLAEGFGLPVTEAMSLGKPVFLSRSGSLPEIGGDEANYWDSFHPDEMAKVVAEGLIRFKEENQREKLMARAALFSWEKAAEDYLCLYKSLA